MEVNASEKQKATSRSLPDTNKSLEKSLTTLSWLVTVNVDELRRKNEREDKVDNYGNKKPAHSYADLIRMAITSTGQERMTLSEIYEFVENKFPYYKSVGGGWKNSIRHNLSLNAIFQKLPRPRDEPGKGSYWIINPNPPKPDNFRQSNRKRANQAKPEYREAKRPTIEDLNNVNYQDIYESIFKPNLQSENPLPSVNSIVNQPSPELAPSPLDGSTATESVTSGESAPPIRPRPQQLPHPLQKPHHYNQAPHSCTEQIEQYPTSDNSHRALCRIPSDPLQWSIDNLKLSQASMRDNPEFQQILSQLKNAESQNWQIDEKSRTSLAFSLSQFMFKQNESASSNPDSDDDVNGFEDINGGEIDYIKLAQL